MKSRIKVLWSLNIERTDSTHRNFKGLKDVGNEQHTAYKEYVDQRKMQAPSLAENRPLRFQIPPPVLIEHKF